MVPLHNFDFDVVKVQKLYDITKPWLENVGALRKKNEDVPFLTHPLLILHHFLVSLLRIPLLLVILLRKLVIIFSLVARV